MVRIARQACRPFLLVVLWSAMLFANAQTPPPSQDAQPITYKVIHDHAIGQGQGELRIIASGIAFKGEGKDEERHNRNWRDEDIKRLAISRDNLRVTVYEAAHIPLIPRKAPFTDGKSIPNGSEHDYLFRLCAGEITPEVVSKLLARFNRSVETSVIPTAESGNLLFELPVFHRQRAGGRSGVLRVYEQYVVFRADAAGDSRFWRYADIRDIGKLGRYNFEIATYEGQFGVEGKSYVFDLLRPLTEAEYETFWTKIYAQGRQIGLRPALNPQKE